MKLPLYTFIFEYAGGTYISQFRGETVEDAFGQWIAGVDMEVMGLKEKHRTKIRRESENYFEPHKLDALVPINEVTHVWCKSFSVKKKFGLLNVVKTAEA